MSTYRFASYTATVTGALICALTLAACSGTPATDESPTPKTPPSTSTTVDQQPTTTAAATPTSNPPSDSTTASPTSRETSTPTSTGLIDPSDEASGARGIPASNAEEAADRAAIERTWVAYNRDFENLWSKPETEWKNFYQKYAAEPFLTSGYEDFKTQVEAGIGTWGSIETHPYWLVSVDGKTEATLMDCSDSRETGRWDIEAEKKLSRGIEHDNTAIYVVRWPDDTWKISSISFLVDVACPGASMTPAEEVESEQNAQKTAAETEQTR